MPQRRLILWFPWEAPWNLQSSLLRNLPRKAWGIPLWAPWPILPRNPQLSLPWDLQLSLLPSSRMIRMSPWW